MGGEGERGCEPQALLLLGFTSGVPRALRFTLLANLKHKSRNVSMGKEKRGRSRNSYLGDPGLSKRGASWAGAPGSSSGCSASLGVTQPELVD